MDEPGTTQRPIPTALGDNDMPLGDRYSVLFIHIIAYFLFAIGRVFSFNLNIFFKIPI